MSENSTGCLICGSPIVYHEEAMEMTCAVCGGTFRSNAECSRGHFVCDKCHSLGLSMVAHVCISSETPDPVALLNRLMRLPGIHMHGPEHHVLVGSALLAAYRNSGGVIDLPAALEKMAERGRNVPGGVCGMWGCCGAAVSCGIAYSIITGTTPMSEESWGRGNILTARCLEAIGALGGPRCCKRDSFSALIVAADYIRETMGIEVPVRTVVCQFSAENPQCLEDRCPYHPSEFADRA